MTFKKMKMRINNPDHSKAVQEWLFEQGYEWTISGSKVTQYFDNGYFYTGSVLRKEISWTGEDSLEYFLSDPREEVDVSHLDPHLDSSEQMVSEATTIDNVYDSIKSILERAAKSGVAIDSIHMDYERLIDGTYILTDMEMNGVKK